jgi:hypothetical protein
LPSAALAYEICLPFGAAGIGLVNGNTDLFETLLPRCHLPPGPSSPIAVLAILDFARDRQRPPPPDRLMAVVASGAFPGLASR